jgi:hypothetical protein
MSAVGLTVHVPGSPPLVPGVPVQSLAIVGSQTLGLTDRLQTLPAPHCESAVQLPQTFAPPPPQTWPFEQSELAQQFPATQLQLSGAPLQSAVAALQQKSLPLAAQAPAAEHADDTHAPLVTLQIVVGP